MTAILLAIHLSAFAQTDWELPQAAAKQTPVAQEKQKEKKEKTEKGKAKENLLAPYLAGAVPEVDGMVVFTRDIDIAGKTAQEIYDTVYRFFEEFVKEDNQIDSRIALVDKGNHAVACRMKEWLVFSENLLSLDRTQMNYTLVAQATDGHLSLKVERISYLYGDASGKTFYTTAEEWISDREALTKDKKKMRIGTKKFRCKTIDRVNEIFEKTTNQFDIQ